MGIEKLVQRLTAMEGGNEVIPRNMKTMLAEHIGNARPLKAGNIAKKECVEDTTDVEGSLGYEKMWERLSWVMGEAARCNAERMSEASWNEMVHAPVLSLALRGHWKSRGIYYCNMTTARISNKSLIPKVVSKSMGSKMVDYAMVIRPDSNMSQRIRHKLLSDNTLSINQTEAEYVRYHPITINIETKRAAIEEDKAYVQQGIWNIAQFSHLERLMKDDAPFPILPLLMIQGHEWKMLIAEIFKTDDNTTAGRKMTFAGHVRIGATDSVVGIYQIISSLRVLARWIDEWYRPWFEAYVLDNPPVERKAKRKGKVVKPSREY